MISKRHHPRHVARIRPRGGGGLKGPQGNPLQNKKLLGFGPLFFARDPFYEQKKIEKFSKKNLIWGPTQIAARDPVTSKFEHHGLQRSPKALFAHPLWSYVAPEAHGIQRSSIGACFRGAIGFSSGAATCSMGHLIRGPSRLQGPHLQRDCIGS